MYQPVVLHSILTKTKVSIEGYNYTTEPLSGNPVAAQNSNGVSYFLLQKLSRHFLSVRA